MGDLSVSVRIIFDAYTEYAHQIVQIKYCTSKSEEMFLSGGIPQPIRLTQF
jgi:hypothetical protein